MSIAVIDIGKTNAKLMVFNRSGETLFEKQMPNASLPGPPYPHVDVEKIWTFLLTSLREANEHHKIDVIVPTTHGASGCVMDEDGLVLPIMDYEFTGLDKIRARYTALRPPFSETFSPDNPNGLNWGRQLAYQAWEFPQDFARASHIMPYPQYWVWRLTGKFSSDISSVGCHSDIWEPKNARPSKLADALDISRRIAPIRPAWDAIGTLKPELVAQTGIDANVPVLCGIHDSNASLLPYLAQIKAPFTVVSTGTWVVMLSVGLDVSGLNPNADMQANIDVNGTPVATAKFMGGREYAEISQGDNAQPSLADIEALMQMNVFALPSFSPNGGPYPHLQGRLIGPAPENRNALATLYSAVMCDHVLDLMGVSTGDIIIDGNFARNSLLCGLIAQLRPQQRVMISKVSTGSALGAACLASWPNTSINVELTQVSPLQAAGLSAYAKRWLSQFAALATH